LRKLFEKDITIYLIFTAICLLVFVWQSLSHTVLYDEGHYFYSAWFETQNLQIFVDYFNVIQKTPGVVWLLSVCTAIFGNTWTAIYAARLISVLIKLLSTLVLFKLLKPIDRKFAIASSLLFAVDPLSNAGSAFIHTETFSNFFYLVASYGLLQLPNSWQKWRWLLAGIALALAFSFRPTAVIFGLVITTFLLIEAWGAYQRGTEKSIFKTIQTIFAKSLQLLLGIAIGLLPLSIYLALNHGFEPFYQSVITFNNIFSSDTLKSGLINKLYDILWQLQNYPIIYGFVIVFSSLGLVIPAEKRFARVQLFARIWFVLMGLVFLQGQSFFDHYFIELLVPAYILAGLAFLPLIKHFRFQGLLTLLFSAILLQGLIMRSFAIPVYNYRNGLLENTTVQTMLNDPSKKIYTNLPILLYFQGVVNKNYSYGQGHEQAYASAGLAKYYGEREIDPLVSIRTSNPDLVVLQRVKDYANYPELLYYLDKNYDRLYISNLEPETAVYYQ